MAFKKRKAKERQAKAAARREQQKPKNVMTRFKGLFDVPGSKKQLLQLNKDEAQKPLLTKDKSNSARRPSQQELDSSGGGTRKKSPFHAMCC